MGHASSDIVPGGRMTCAIAVMAKAPRPGQVKTRLTPPLPPEEAMQMGSAFLTDITHNIQLAARDADIAGFVAYAPAGAEALFDGLLAPGTGLVLADGSDAMPDAVTGFGRSLQHAAQALFARGYSSVCLLNADSPTLPTGYLTAAARALAEPGRRAVLGGAEDGGYYLIGLQRPEPALFTGITWSTDVVATQTRAAAAAIGLALHELPEWFDVDDVAGLRRLLADGDDGGFACPATRATVARLLIGQRLA